MSDCPLCTEAGGRVLFEGGAFRVVAVDDAAFPGFTRIIWTGHIAEMTDLSADDRRRLMAVVWTVETVMRTVLRPDKINLASLGNVVPHLHWHVIARWREDSHFPDPIWASPKRASTLQVSIERVDAYELALQQALAETAAPAVGGIRPSDTI